MSAEHMRAVREGQQRFWDRVRSGEILHPRTRKRLEKEAEEAARKHSRNALGKVQEISQAKCSELTGKTLLSNDEIVAASQKVPFLCGIYFLIKDEKVVYVGQSINVMARVTAHAGSKDFDRMAYLPCDKKLLNRLESLYIHTLRPRLNGNHCLTGTKMAPLNLRDLLGLDLENVVERS